MAIAPGAPQALGVRLIPVLCAAALALTGCVPLEDGTGTASAPPTVADDSARLLGQLTVARASSMKGYSRNRFPHWRDEGRNCDVRDTVLKRDGEQIRLTGCNVVGGQWVSVYDDRTFDDPSDVDIDHMVPLANAWRSGADKWTDEERGDFANDLTRPQLRAVSASSNRSKGDQDPSQWKPPNRDFWCEYAAEWIAVKHYWKLRITTEEKAALSDMLDTCPAARE
ncbi:HNH endonuclease family protein [Phytohabitans kaempferiae]|uniref:HNH endonuclease family protein n=1 Tax=Phytohabitans kaempferiae TaxID=1620943 RepID=A0ABV6MES0_9ACTN